MTSKAGQKCTAIRRAIVPTAAADALDRAPSGRASTNAWSSAIPAPRGVTMGPLASLAQRDEVLRQVAELEAAGGEIVVGDLDDAPTVTRADGSTGDRRRRARSFRRCCCDSRMPHPDAVHRVEAFGPVASLLTYDSLSRGRRPRRSRRRIARHQHRHPRSRRRRRADRAASRRSTAACCCSTATTRARRPVTARRCRTSCTADPAAPAGAKSSAASAPCCTTCSAPRCRARPRCSPPSPGCGTPVPPRTPSGRHPFRKSLAELRIGDQIASALARGRRSTTSRRSRTSPATRSTRTWTRRRPRRTRSSPAASRTATCSCRGRRACSSTPSPVRCSPTTALENLRFITPVSPGDAIRVELTAKQITPRETDEYGEVRWDAVIRNQNDEIVAHVRRADPRRKGARRGVSATSLSGRERPVGRQRPAAHLGDDLAGLVGDRHVVEPRAAAARAPHRRRGEHLAGRRRAAETSRRPPARR